jgi:hypothetical protein
MGTSNCFPVWQVLIDHQANGAHNLKSTGIYATKGKGPAGAGVLGPACMMTT